MVHKRFPPWMFDEQGKGDTKRFIAEVDGIQVFSTDYVLHRNMYLSRRIDRAQEIAIAAVIVAIASVVLNIWQLLH